MKDGGSAFPVHTDLQGMYVSGYVDEKGRTTMLAKGTGMTLRQWYKGMALAGMTSNVDYTSNPCGEVAKMAGDYADACLHEDEEAGR